MSYIDVLLDRSSDKVHIAQRIDGHRTLSTVAANYVFYYTDPSGSHRSIFDHPCKKYSSHSSFKFRAALADHRRAADGIFESDINPIFRCLAENFTDADVPALHIGFFDIEADFDADRGFAPTHDPFNAITAISLYRSADQRLISWVLCPPTMDLEAAHELAGQFADTHMFADEAALLSGFLDAIEDVDVLSGWNCLPKTQSVWLHNRITTLADVTTVEIETAQHGKVIARHDSGMKTVNRITLDNGLVIDASDEHVIPFFTKSSGSYNRPSSLTKTETEHRVDAIKARLVEGGDDLYMEIALRTNTNAPYTYRDYLIENLEQFLAVEDFDVAVSSTALRDKLRPTIQTKHSRYISSFLDYPCMWRSKLHPSLTRHDLIQQIQDADSVTVVFKGNRLFKVRLDSVIPNDVFQLLGMQFTDGTYDSTRKGFTIYSKYPALLEYYREIVRAEYDMKTGATGGINVANDGCAAFDYRRGCVIGFLAPMIYTETWNKRLHLQMLSRLSLEQFQAFVSGLIDGDGCVTDKSLTVCNYEGCEQTLLELLLWNGVYASTSPNNVRISVNSNNQTFIQSLSVQHPVRASRVANFEYFDVQNCSNRCLKKFLLADRAIVRIRKIEAMAIPVPTADIQTELQFFHSRGVRVHNSAGYDVPYLVNRVACVLGQAATKQFCLWDQTPTKREYLDKFGKMVMTYDFVGRVHLDYIELYRKHNTQQRLSYALNAIGEIEVGETKTPYEGTLDDLYKKDLYKFIAYNRQDVMLMVKIDNKNRYIELANQIAHANCVLLKTTMGSVALVEHAIINEMHAMGRVVPDRKPREFIKSEDTGSPEIDDDDDDDEQSPVVGAYVAHPKTGLQEQVGAIDINSLYPNTIRALNMSPETLIGQVRSDETNRLVEERAAKLPGTRRAEAWEGLFCSLEVQHMLDQDETVLTIDFVDNMSGVTSIVQMTGQQLHAFIFAPANGVCITANGTIFRTDVEGMIPALLAKWYAERKVMQKKSKEYAAVASSGISISPELAASIREME